MRRFDFQTKLICFGTLLVAISVGVSWLIAYQQSKVSLERSLARELLAIVNSLAPQVDGNLLDPALRGKSGEPDGPEELALIRKQLARVKEANGLEGSGSPLYILRKAPDFSLSREFEFVVLSGGDERGVTSTRSRYTARPHSLAALEGSGAVTGVYTDPEGAWISAAAPVRDSEGRVTGILQADRPVNSFYQDARNQVLAILPGAIVSLVIATILSVLLGRSIARPVRHLLRATELLAGGDLDHTVDIRRNDELGDLAEGFKRMAREMKAWRGTIEAREVALMRAGRDARAGSSAKGEFLATMSHEIRTPMNAILGFNHLLLDTKLDVRQRSFAETVAASGESLLKILNDVLDFSKMEAGKLTLETLEFDPREVIETSLDLLAVAARSKGIEIASRIEGTVPACLRGDPGRLRQVLVNL
ncbi:MAG TPA: histidine kinase dimerization/phospho-acceptor domain-containing protein, partial [Planctomycetota bacterium]|nr:histidine kinase dimerization/phospho-acceptor domain-containing protein [Planctomycetota bacterium]